MSHQQRRDCESPGTLSSAKSLWGYHSKLVSPPFEIMYPFFYVFPIHFLLGPCVHCFVLSITTWGSLVWPIINLLCFFLQSVLFYMLPIKGVSPMFLCKDTSFLHGDCGYEGMLYKILWGFNYSPVNARSKVKITMGSSFRVTLWDNLGLGLGYEVLKSRLVAWVFSFFLGILWF